MAPDLQDVVRHPARRQEEVHGVQQDDSESRSRLTLRKRDVAPGLERVTEADIARGTRGHAHEHLRWHAGDAELGSGDAVARGVTEEPGVDVGVARVTRR